MLEQYETSKNFIKNINQSLKISSLFNEASCTLITELSYA